jgi:hypothetical protein
MILYYLKLSSVEKITKEFFETKYLKVKKGQILESQKRSKYTMIKEGQTDDLLFFYLLVRKDQSQIKKESFGRSFRV